MSEIEIDPQVSLGESFGKLYEKRVENNQDLIVVVDDEHNRRGTGKTALSLGMASVMDRTDEGLTTNKCHINPQGLIQAYTDQPPGSALVLDEAEVGVSKYRAGSASNMAIRQLVSMGRIEEKYVVLNLPNTAELDSDLKSLCDVWVMVTQKGHAVVHFLGYNKYRNHPLTKKKHPIKWTDLSDPDLESIYEDLTEEKRKRLRGEAEESQFIQPDQVQDRVAEAEESASRKERNRIIRNLSDNTGMTHKEIADQVGVSRSTVTQILNEYQESPSPSP